jgi:exopolysaccharide biosynthesis polyprenyl glycosylphosphotransferase
MKPVDSAGLAVRTLSPASHLEVKRPARVSSGMGRTRVVDHRYRVLLGLADVFACAGALIACTALGDDRVSGGVILALPLVVGISKLLGLYDRDELVLRKSTLDEAPTLFQLATLFALLVWIAEAPLRIGELGQGEVAVLWGSLFLLLIAARVAARTVARRTTAPERCLLLGDPAACRRVRAKITESASVNAEVVAEIASARIGEEEVPFSLLADIAAEQEIQRVIIAPRSTDHSDVLNLVRAAKAIGLKVSVLPRLLEIVGSSVVVDDVEGLRVLGVSRFGLSRSSLLVKRILDVAASAATLVVLAPLFALIAIAVKADSPGPVFFRQRRIGRDGRAFSMLKFRTMCEGADALKDALRDLNEAPGLFKIAADPRVTRVGRLLRRSSLDELPQLVNVLRGEMSLVGPRPLVGEDDSRIEGWDRHRLHLTPGITGPWQVLGPGRLPLAEMVKLDYLYVATWSLWGDVKILLRTLGFVLGRRGI